MKYHFSKLPIVYPIPPYHLHMHNKFLVSYKYVNSHVLVFSLSLEDHFGSTEHFFSGYVFTDIVYVHHVELNIVIIVQ